MINGALHKAEINKKKCKSGTKFETVTIEHPASHCPIFTVKEEKRPVNFITENLILKWEV